MAWIAVHEQIDGAKLRQLKKAIGCSKLEALGILVKLWLWGLDNADRAGELKSADRDDVAEVFAFDLSKKLSPTSVVDALVETGWLDADGDRLFLHDWMDWQDHWYKALDKREKDKTRKRTEAEKKRTEKQEKFHGNSEEEQAAFHGNSTENLSQPSPTPSSSPYRQDPSTGEDTEKESVGAAAPTPPPPTAPESEKGPVKRKYGEYGWVRLTDDEYARLQKDLGEAELARCITYIDESAQANGNKNRWKDWNLVVRKCHRDGWGLGSTQSRRNGGKQDGGHQQSVERDVDFYARGFQRADE